MSQALGAFALGTEPLAGDPLHDPPTVDVATLGTVNTGGPELTIAWDYSQPQGDPQSAYRVQIWNDALTVMHYDSGWLTGTEEQWTFDLDESDAPHDSTDVTARVLVRSGVNVAFDDEPFAIEWGVPHCTITQPTEGTVFTNLDNGIQVAWSFSDDRMGKTQSAYRVRLLLNSGLELHDTGWVDSTDTSYTIPVPLTDETQYQVEVQLRNNHGIRSN